MRWVVWAWMLSGVVAGSAAAPAAARELPIERIRLPEGFAISVYAENVPNARAMTRSPNGTLFAGSRGAGRVYAMRDADGDQRADRVFVIAHGLQMPNGVAFRGGALYVAERSRILRFDDIEARLDDPPEPVVVRDDFPTDRSHGWKFIAFGPDGRLYVPVGAPCNVCESEDPRYAAITRMRPDGSEFEIIARGVRNTVGFTWHPQTQELWFTDNGRDWLGDNLPPDELNRLPEPGAHFGFPYCHGGGLTDPEFGAKRSCEEFTPAVQELGPHVASLGLRFYTGAQFPEGYHHQLFIAEHGSWNRSVPLGYRLTVVRLAGSEPTAYDVFAEGWLMSNGKPWGRPVDVEVMPDGALLVSDDFAGAIYRISYAEP